MRRTLMLAPLTCLCLLIVIVACNENGIVESSVGAQTTQTADTAKSNSTAAKVLAANLSDHEDPTDYVWDSQQVVSVALNETSISESSESVTVEGTRATIMSPGTYSLRGSLKNGQIVVNSPDIGPVRLILDGVSIANTTTAPLSVEKADKVILVLAANTVNTLTDGSSYVFESADQDEPNAALFSKADLTICGTGALTVNGNFNDAIASKDGLILKSGNVTANAVDDGIRGKDYLVIKGGMITVNASGDALKSDNDSDPTRGYVYVEDGSLNITSGNDGIDAETDAIVSRGSLILTTGGGSSRTVSGTTSAKAIKGTVCVAIDNGTFSINAADDAVHSNATVVINGGTFTIATGDDGIHGDSLVAVNGGEITITKCYEGIESTSLSLTGGTIHITASDDGINGAGGNDGSGMDGWPGGSPPTGNRFLSITGGYVAVTAVGDGIDVNGSISMSGGTVIVNGPTSNANGAIDYDASYTMTGGFIVAAGSSGMAQAPGATSSQNSLLVTFSTAKSAGTLFHIQASDGTDIVTFRPTKNYQSVALCSPQLRRGSTYEVYVGGSSSGTVKDGLYEGGSFSGGTRAGSFTISGIVTRVGF